jgi:hypothetical protein
MNEAENLSDSPQTLDLQQQVVRLQRQANFLFLGLVILSLTFTAFVGVQYWRMKKDLDFVRQQRTQIEEANKKEGPAIQSLISQLAGYGQGHPDYDKILLKYGIKRADGAAGNAAPANPAQKK